MLAILLLLASLAGLLFLIVRYFRFFWLLCKLPYAKGIPLLGHAITFWPGKDVLLDRMLEIGKDHENVNIIRKDGILAVWLGPVPFVLIHNLDDIEKIMSSNSLTKKGPQYGFFKDWLGGGLFSTNEPHHWKHRKLITPAFHFKILEKYVPIFNSNINTFLNLMDGKVGKESFDIKHYLYYLTIDIIAEISAGVSINTQTTDSSYAKAEQELLNLIVDRGCRPLLYPDFIFKMSPLGRKQKNILKFIHGFTNDLIKKGKSKRNEIEGKGIGMKEKTFLDILLEAQKASPDFTDKDIMDEFSTVMFGGHDTVASALFFIFHLLGKYTWAQEEIFKEIDSVIGGDELTYNNLQELTYLERVIKESMRRYPVTPFVFREVTKDIKLNSGYILPKGTQTMVFFYYLHNDPLLYPNPEVFDPDRFLPENCTERHPFSYLPFSAGPRNCIGQKMGKMMLKAIVASTVRRFKIISKGNLKPTIHVTLQPSDGVHVVLERRTNRDKNT